MNLIPWNLFLSLIFAALHFWATTDPRDCLDKAPPYTPAYCIKHNSTIIYKAYLGFIKKTCETVSLEPLSPKHVNSKNNLLVNTTNM